jgi:hypothetical protein
MRKLAVFFSRYGRMAGLPALVISLLALGVSTISLAYIVASYNYQVRGDRPDLVSSGPRIYPTLSPPRIELYWSNVGKRVARLPQVRVFRLNDDDTTNELVASGAIAGAGTNLLPGAGSLFSFSWVYGVRKPFKLLACVSYLDDTERRFTQSFVFELSQAPGEESRINLNETRKFNEDKCPDVRT